MILRNSRILFTALLVSLQSVAAATNTFLGFGEKAQTEEKLLEDKFDSFLDPNNLQEWMQRLTAHPHHVGSPYGKENAEFILSLFRSWGYESEFARYQILFPTPKLRLLELLAPEAFSANLMEVALKEDATSQQTKEQLPPYNAYSIDGDVTGELVYVNYGLEADYNHLTQKGINIKGKIAISRYGGS